MVIDIFEQISAACEKLEITLVGGHTEITYDLARPIVVGQMLGEVPKDRLITPEGLRAGDLIVVTKQAPVEGTALIAREKPNELREAGLSEETLQRCAQMLFDPGISVLADAQIAVGNGDVHAMHDPTEGGVSTGLYEISTASGKGLTIEADAIIVRDETRRICDFFGLDPLGLMGSGALLLTMPPRKVDAYLDALKEEGVEASVIGRMTKRSAGMKVIEGGRKRPLKFSERDEVLRVL